MIHAAIAFLSAAVFLSAALPALASGGVLENKDTANIEISPDTRSACSG
jgi:hypothetical protein